MRAACLLSLALPLLLPPNAMAQQKKPDLDRLLEKKVFEKDRAKLPYRLMKPADYKEDGKDSYPLVVFLHGSGERGKDNAKQLVHGVADFASDANRKKYPCFLIAPQCPSDEFWVWGLLPKLEKKLKKPAVEAGDLALALTEAVCKDYRIDRKRIYLTGLSMGGYGTWELLARKPDLFAAAIPICGGGHVENAKKIAKIPIWCFHGDKDGAVPVEESRKMIEAVKKAGGKPEYTEYEGVDHDSWTRTYRDAKVHEWLFAQKKKE